MTIQIQSVGRVEAKEAQTFKVGDKILWNFGSTSIIKAIHKETAKQIQFITDEYNNRGELTRENIINRRFGKTRLLAIA